MSVTGAASQPRADAATALFSLGFRPFFLFGAAFAGVAIPLWFAVLAGKVSGGGSPLLWHAHEMIFGYLAAVAAGFLLTAIPNWTGCKPLQGRALAALFALWVAGRVAMFSPDPGVAARLIDAAFLFALAGVAWQQLRSGAGGNLAIFAVIVVYALANVLFHVEALDYHVGIEERAGIRLGLSTAVLMMMLIGGRIIPMFTTNWLRRNGKAQQAAPFGAFDKIAVLGTAVALVLWFIAPYETITGAALVAAGALNAARLARWRGWLTTSDLLLFVLHVAYAWIPVGLVLLGLAILEVGDIPDAAALHALTAGAIGLLTLGVMTRVSRAHTGNPLVAGPWTVAIYLLCFVGGVARVVLPMTSLHPITAAIVAGSIWASAMLLFVVVYGPMLLRPRTR